ncbi:hypothetical protein ACJA29_01500 [Metamycoplasma sualvi]|uniref:hypothetical protein n=1 Tax=Metamycoplasma sualvi TaxID=2125 RepID=UPI0038734C70
MFIISKKKMNELLNLSNDPKIELVEETKKSYKIKITGDKDKVKKSSFENKVLEFMSDMTEFVKEQKEFNNSVVDFIKEQKEFNKEQKEFNNSVVDFMKEQKEFNQKVDQRLHNVDQRLSVLEKDVKQIKLLPTIKKELKT